MSPRRQAAVLVAFAGAVVTAGLVVSGDRPARRRADDRGRRPVGDRVVVPADRPARRGPPPAAAPDPLLTTLVGLETGYLEAIKRKDVATLRRMSAADKTIVSIGGGRGNLDEFLSAVPGWDLTGYELTDPKVVAVSPDAGVLTARITTTFGGTGKRTVEASSVWARRWQGVAFHETSCPKPVAPIPAGPGEVDPADAEVIGLERSYWEALTTVDRPTLARLTAPEKFVVLVDGSRHPQADILGGLGRTWKMSGYALDDIRVVRPTADAAVVSYRATTTIDGAEKTIRASSVWARRWQVCAYHETSPTE